MSCVRLIDGHIDYPAARLDDAEIPETTIAHITDEICPECGNRMECACAVGAYETSSGLTERLYICYKCGFTLSTCTKEE